MKITITARELMDRGVWMEFCRLTGTNEWCVNEGQADGDTEFSLTDNQAIKLGLIKVKSCGGSW